VFRNLREYYRPASPEEAVRIKEEFGSEGAYLGGGSDLMVHKPEGIRAMIDIRHAGMGEVGRENGDYVIGGGALLRDAEAALAEVAGGMLSQALRETAPWLIRNAATVSGNIANASPAADSVPALLALDARLSLRGQGESDVPLQDIQIGPHHTALGNRLIEQIRVPADAAGRHAAFIKLARSKSDLAIANVAVSFHLQGSVMSSVRIALGAVAPTPFRAAATEALIEGKELTPELLDAVDSTVQGEASPIDDWRATAAYRRRMSGVLVRRALARALDTARSGETQ
jgi:CO/xanthine dehydrogenase FAD-binding subunit